MASSTVDRRLGLSGNAAIKTPCKCATTANITLSGEQTIDGVLTASTRVLVKDQSTGADNGIYVSDSGAWTRDLDFDGSYDAKCGTLIFVTNGSANGAGLFQLTTADTITIGTTSLTFTKIATLSASSVTQANVQNGQFVVLTSVAGTNTISAATVGTAPAALGAGQYVFFLPANTNTGATTLARDGFAALSIFYNNAALIGGELVQNIPALLYEDGTQYHIVATAISDMNFQTTGSVASATTVNLNSAKPYSQITGAVQIDAITLGNGRVRVVEFASTPQVTYGASLLLPTAASVTAQAGDVACFVGEASSVVRCLWWTRADGTALYVSPGASNFSTGDVKLTLKTTADSGWVLMDDKTIGNAASGATGRANADTVDLFTLLWNNTADAQCAVSTGRGANAAADYAANKTIALPKALGRALATYGAGSGLTSRVLALTTGVETHPLITAELASHTHTGTTGGQSATHTHAGVLTSSGSQVGAATTGGDIGSTGNASGDHTHTITTDATGSGTAHQNMQPTLFLSTMIKL